MTKGHKLQLMSLLLLGASIALAVKVSTDYNKAIDFTHYRTYSWMQVKADPLWTDRIREAVDSQLTAKGWSRVPDGGDASVAAFGATREQPRIETFYNDFGGGWYWRGFGDGMATTTVDYTQVGSLVVDIFDTPTKKLIWRGVATDVLSSKPDKNEKKLEKAVQEMFEHFPPKSKG